MRNKYFKTIRVQSEEHVSRHQDFKATHGTMAMYFKLFLDILQSQRFMKPGEVHAARLRQDFKTCELCIEF